MRTDALLDALAADPPARRSWRPASAMIAGLVGGLVSLAALLATLGARADLTSALADPRVAYKFALAAAAGVVGALLVVRLVRPEAGRGGSWLVAALVGVAVGAFLLDFATMEPAARMPALMGDGPWKCLLLVVALAVPPAGLLLAALRRGAPGSPAAVGAAAGLLGGAIAAGIFALNCRNDTAVFVSVWYGLGIGLAAAAGALAGRRLLAW